MFFENFLSLIDCLISLKLEVLEMGDFDVGIFILLVLVILGSTEYKSELVVISSCNTSENQGH